MLTSLFAAALIAAHAHSNAAPRRIDDCEQIQAADAYNQCLALFGPVARGHGATDWGRQDAEATTGNANARVATAGDSGRGHGARHASKHGWARHSWARHGWARHGHWHGTGAAGHRHGHGKGTALAFSVGSGHTRLR